MTGNAQAQEQVLSPDEDLIDSPTITQPEEGAKLSPTEGAADGEGRQQDQEGVQKRINKLTWEKHEEKRQREAAERRIQELEQQQQQAQTPQLKPVPAKPEPYDEDYDRKIAEREEIIKHNAKVEAQNEFYQQQTQTTIQQQQQQQMEQTNNIVNAYYQKAAEKSITVDQALQNAQIVDQYIVNQDLSLFIVGHERGPEITKHLAGNIEELDKISRMNPFEASSYISTSIVNAINQTPTQSNAPDPPEDLGGKGRSVEGNPFIKNAKFY